MSIASPTLRSSSSTVPGPSRNSSPTSMRARPSTADTCTGTSNTASRSAAPRVVGSLSGASAPASLTVGMPPFSRSGSGTFVSSLISRLLRSSMRRCGARRDVAGDHVVDDGEHRRPVAVHAAFAPFDAAVAGRERRVRLHHQAAFETARLRDLLELVLAGRVEIGADAHGYVRRLHQMAEAFGG